MRKRSLSTLFIALLASAAALVFDVGAHAQFENWPHLYNAIQSGPGSVFDELIVMKTADIFDPHDPNYEFNIHHFEQRLDIKAPPGSEHKLLLLDVEWQEYPDGHRVNREKPEDFMTALSAAILLRPDHVIGMDGGLSTSWGIIAKDENGEYRHHDLWIKDSERWREVVEMADFWATSHYRDTRRQSAWRHRLRIFGDLFEQQFPGKPLAVYIWHRERIDREGGSVWISGRDYVEMGLWGQRLGLSVISFGREDDPEDYALAMKYFDALAKRW